MTLTYKDDDSFFITVFPPFIHHGLFIKNWLSKNESSKFRYIRDLEVENKFLNISQVKEIYPGVKVIGLVLNPWNRMVHSYKKMCMMRDSGSSEYDINFDLLNLNTFEDFVKDLLNNTKVEPFWFTLSTPQSKWYNTQDDIAEYVLRAESLDEDIQVLREYFCSDVPLEDSRIPDLISLELPSYREYYNDETRNIVAEIFKEDIEKYRYEF